MKTLRPEPSVEGYTTLAATLPSRQTDRITELHGNRHGDPNEFPGKILSGIGGIETGHDAAEFILLGCDCVQVCTGVMKMGYGMVKPMIDDLSAFMDEHGFNSIADFKGHSLQFFRTHGELVEIQAEARAKRKAESAAKTAAAAQQDEKMIREDAQWTGDDFVEQSDALSRGSGSKLDGIVVKCLTRCRRRGYAVIPLVFGIGLNKIQTLTTHPNDNARRAFNLILKMVGLTLKKLAVPFGSDELPVADLDLSSNHHRFGSTSDLPTIKCTVIDIHLLGLG